MSFTRQVLAGSAQLTLANALARVLGLISLPLLTHWLSPQAYGQAALANTLMALVAVVGLMGMDMSYARSYLSRTPPNGDRAERFCWRWAMIASLLSGLVAAAIWCVHAFLDSAARPDLAALVMAGVGGSLLLAMAQTRMRLLGRHRRLAASVALGGTLATGLSLFLAWRWFADERALVAGFVAAYLAPVLIMGMPSWRELREASGLDAGARREILLVGLPGVVTAPMYWVLASSDRWFLQAYTDSATVGLYAVACTFGQLGMMATTALLAIWLPEATRLHESDENDVDRKLALLMTRLILLLACVWLGVALFGGDALRWLTARQFHSGEWVVPWLATAVFAYGCYHLANTGLFLRRKLAHTAKLWIGVGIFAMVANGALVPRYGMLAAAIVQCASFSLLAAFVMRASQKRHPLPLPFVRLGLALILCIGVLAAGTLFPANSGRGGLVFKALFYLVAIVPIVYAAEPSLPALAWRFLMARLPRRGSSHVR